MAEPTGHIGSVDDIPSALGVSFKSVYHHAGRWD